MLAETGIPGGGGGGGGGVLFTFHGCYKVILRDSEIFDQTQNVMKFHGCCKVILRDSETFAQTENGLKSCRISLKSPEKFSL